MGTKFPARQLTLFMSLSVPIQAAFLKCIFSSERLFDSIARLQVVSEKVVEGLVGSGSAVKMESQNSMV